MTTRVIKTAVVALLALLMTTPAMAGKDKSQQGSEALPPGLQKKVNRGGQLPPGWQKKLQKGKRLDDELYHLSEPVPEHMRLKLPMGPAGSVEVRLEGKIVRLDRATREILDIFDIQ